jgi:hypothetical protein
VASGSLCSKGTAPSLVSRPPSASCRQRPTGRRRPPARGQRSWGTAAAWPAPELLVHRGRPQPAHKAQRAQLVDDVFLRAGFVEQNAH